MADGLGDGGLDRGATRPGELEIQTMTILTTPMRLRHRRHMLGWAALASIGAITGPTGLTGCSQADNSSAQSLKPVEIDGATSCELDGMLLADYPGPRRRCALRGKTSPRSSATRWNCLPPCWQANSAGRPGGVRAGHGPGRLECPKGHWIDAKTAVYVVGGKRHGSMGPTIGSFAQEADAKKFAGEYGGKVLRFAEITPAMVDLSGGALHDTRM